MIDAGGTVGMALYGMRLLFGVGCGVYGYEVGKAAWGDGCIDRTLLWLEIKEKPSLRRERLPPGRVSIGLLSPVALLLYNLYLFCIRSTSIRLV